MTSSKYVRSFKRCNLVFSVIFLLLVSGYAGTAAFLEGGHPAFMERTVLFVSCILPESLRERMNSHCSKASA